MDNLIPLTTEHLILFLTIFFILGVVVGMIVPMIINALIYFYLKWQTHREKRREQKLLTHQTEIEIPKTTSQWRTLLKQLLRSDDD